MVPFAGWEMSVQYSGILEEHKAVRTKAGLFDVSHMGEIEVTGSQARDFLDYLLPNRVGKLAVGKVLYSPLCQENGGVLDDLLVYAMASDRFLLCVNASNTESDYAWISGQAERFECSVHNVSASWFQLALQGPAWRAVMTSAFPKYESFPPRFRFETMAWEGAELLVSRTGYTGEDGLEIYGPPELAVKLADLLMDAGEEHGLVPAGLGARDSLRLEAGLPLYGHELSEDISPLEAGIGWTVHLEKEDFIGRSALADQKERGLERKVVYFTTEDRRIARQDTPVWEATGAEAEVRQVGKVLSGTLSPILNRPIGSALVETSALDQPMMVQLRGHQIPLILKKPPLHLDSNE